MDTRLEELRGKKLGPILQGEKTDRETAARIRNAVHACRACHETILNYHKSGLPYWVEISITPICDESGEPLWLVAREREVSGLRVAVTQEICARARPLLFTAGARSSRAAPAFLDGFAL